MRASNHSTYQALRVGPPPDGLGAPPAAQKERSKKMKVKKREGVVEGNRKDQESKGKESAEESILEIL